MRTLEEKRASAIADLHRLRDGWRPTAVELRDAVGLVDWEVRCEAGSEIHVLWGFSINHPRLGNRLIRTSRVLWISDDCTVARTFSRWYRLGACKKPVDQRSTFEAPDADELKPSH